MSEIHYQGRPARREGSEQRRRSILEAALRIIVREGIRNVRHRAVAKEADVPLSATTYYFKDISDLIADTFTLFAEQALVEVVEPFRLQIFAAMEQFESQRSVEPTAVEKLLELRSEEHTSELQSRPHLVCRLLLEKKKILQILVFHQS